MNYTLIAARDKYPDAEMILLDLAEYNLVFGDGRDYREYEGDTRYVAETIMAADALIMGTPTFQASIPATLKNVFDLLPVNAFAARSSVCWQRQGLRNIF
ncbi:hypothetical protein J14TS5_10270 [Paenibacillus lautus]|nr:hypothetical protein J14TS5_10270 [Paenibacillus lautus]